MKNLFYIICFIALYGCCKTHISTEVLKQPLVINSESLDKSTGNVLQEKLLFSTQIKNLACKQIEIYRNSIPSGHNYEFALILHQKCDSECSWNDSYNKIIQSSIVQGMCSNSNDTLVLFMIDGSVSDTGSTTAYCNQYGFCSSSKVYAISQTFYPLIRIEK